MAIRNILLTGAIDDENPVVHDLHLKGGQLVFLENNELAAAQGIKCRLLMFKGEFFLDQSLGIPYFEEILKKGVNLVRIRDIVRTAIASEPGIVEVVDVRLELDGATREATISWEVLHDSGAVINSDQYLQLFIEEVTQ